MVLEIFVAAEVEDLPYAVDVSDAGDLVRAALDLLKGKQHDAAMALLAPERVPADATLADRIAWADALADAREPVLSDAMFEVLLERHTGERSLHVTYAKRLYARGNLLHALALMEVVADKLTQGSAALSLLLRLRRLHSVLVAREGGPLDPHLDARMLAFQHAVAAYANREPRHLPEGRLGGLSLITGSLGPGGAERQLSRTAAELERLRQRDGQVGGIVIEHAVEVLVRSHGPEKQNNFFLPDLQDAAVSIAEINIMEPVTPASFGIEDRELQLLLEFLPAKVNFGLRRLVPHFQRTRPDVVSIWQDGACLFAALAAVVAGVPRIQLVIRGLPPVIRRHLFLPEYEVMYRALARVPGVQFISNSKAAAHAYAEWLDLPENRFSIVYNGVPRMVCDASGGLDAQWQEFVAATPDATHTVGGVFRFDTDKRPLTWIRFAARYARHHPDTRFLMVGGGRLLEEAQKMAADLHVADRILFVGRSTDVGYWMKKMDVNVLMSSFEGLPNVLIEAQYLGVPVVSTPAGGAAECFIEGVTGHILGCADKTDLDEACAKVQALLGRAHDQEIFGPATRDFLDPNFAVTRMLDNFIEITCRRPAHQGGMPAFHSASGHPAFGD